MGHEVTDEQLRIAVQANRSWRGVLRTLGLTSPRTGRELKARCDVLGVDYRHFRAGGPDESLLRSAVAQASCWDDVLAALGYAPGSGTARARLRKRCAGLGVDTSHLSAAVGHELHEMPLVPSLAHLRSAAPMLVAGLLTLSGHRVSWPLEPAPYDLVTDTGTRTLRIQVKTSTRRQDGTYVCRLTHSTYDPALGRSVPDVYTRDQVDAFALVDGDLRVYLVPHAAVAGRTAVYVREYERFLVRLPTAS